MLPSVAPRSVRKLSVRLLALRFGMLLLPILLLALAAMRANLENRPPYLLWIATGFQAALSALVLRSRRLGRNPLGSTVLVLYVVALTGLAFGQGLAGQYDWFSRFAHGLLFLIGMMFFARLVVIESGQRDRYEASTRALALAERTDWPAELHRCRDLPEAKAFCEAVRNDASPAFSLLVSKQPQAQLVGLSALEGKHDWLPGQSDMLAELLRRSKEPEVRALAIRILAPQAGRRLVEKLAEYLRDPHAEVRRAALELLRSKPEERWPWMRDRAREALSQLAQQGDGPLLPERALLPPEAVKDLKAWIAEKGILTLRAALTLVAHYERLLIEQRDEKLIQELRRQLLEAHTPAILRIELAQLLQGRQLLDRPTHEKLLDPLNSAPLRVMAADALLSNGNHAGATTALRDVARMPNRDIALATADVVQRRLGIDLGLALGQPFPSVTSRQAADITRRVMAWAREAELADADDDTKMILQ